MRILLRQGLSMFKPLWLVGLLLFGFSSSAFAVEYPYYAKPSMTNILRTLIRHGAIDVNNDEIIDIYARTFDCPHFVKSYPDEFKWEAERNVIRTQIIDSIYSYPVAFRYDAELQLARYDFNKKVYPFYRSDKKQKNFTANTFVVEAKESEGCGNYEDPIPLRYKFVLNKTVHLDGLHLNEDQGRILIKRLDQQENTDHIIYARFNMRVKYIASIVPNEVIKKAYAAQLNKKHRPRIAIMQSSTGNYVVIDSELDSIEYYEDKERTHLIYTYRP